jgi:hypothetical protein
MDFSNMNLIYTITYVEPLPRKRLWHGFRVCREFLFLGLTTMMMKHGQLFSLHFYNDLEIWVDRSLYDVAPDRTLKQRYLNRYRTQDIRIQSQMLFDTFFGVATVNMSLLKLKSMKWYKAWCNTLNEIELAIVNEAEQSLRTDVSTSTAWFQFWRFKCCQACMDRNTWLFFGSHEIVRNNRYDTLHKFC